jgi:hypothetical protein
MDAWLGQTDQKTRTSLEIAYVHLSQFQDGVGDKPIDCKLPSDVTPEKKMAVLEPYLRFSSAVTEEAESLRAELEEFKRRKALELSLMRGRAPVIGYTVCRRELLRAQGCSGAFT